MPLNPQSGNMYPFVTHTWNPIKGRCSHDCVYCYMKRFPQKPIRLDERELRTNLGEENFIFVGSSTDMWAEDVPNEWIIQVLLAVLDAPDNTYLYQSKNPEQFIKLGAVADEIYGTTIETNRIDYHESKAPDVFARAQAMQKLADDGHRTMITIEPVMDFNTDVLSAMIKRCRPEWVNIGADSKGHGLPEPSPEKLRDLIGALDEFTEVKLKSNLDRLLTTGRG